MKPTNSKISTCPALETLSAFYDGELPDSSISKHLADCPRCSSILKDFSVMGRALELAVEAKTPPDVSERILAGVRGRIRQETKKKFDFYSPVMIYGRVAALVAILGIAGFMVWNEMSSESTPALSTPRVLQTSSTEAGLSAAPTAKYRMQKFGSVDVADLDSASFSNVPLHQNDVSLSRNSSQSRAYIADVVKQTWLVPAVEDSGLQTNLAGLMKKLGISGEKVFLAREKGHFSITFHASKSQTVRFVRACRKFGYSLLSPVQPQPEQESFLGSPDEQISYTADFYDR